MKTPFYQDDLFGLLPALTERRVREVTHPMVSFLEASVMEPWEELQRYRTEDINFSDLTEEEVAQWLTIQAAHRARKLFANEDSVKLLSIHRKLVIYVVDELTITIKKLTKRALRRFGPEELTRSNFPTKRSIDFYRQSRNLGVPDVPRIVFGYQLLREITEIKLWIAYPRTQGKGFEWAYVLHGAPKKMGIFVGETGDGGDQGGKDFVITASDDAAKADGQ